MVKTLLSLLIALIIIVFSYLAFSYLPSLLAPSNGQLRLTVNGRSINVFLDGKNLGKSPFFGSNLKVGDHLLKVQPTDNLSTYPWEQSVSLQSNTVTNLNLDLGPDKLFSANDYLSFSTGASGISVITYPKSSSISSDGKVLGASPKNFDLALGTHLLTISKTGYLTREISISLEKGYHLSAVVYLAANPFPKIDKIETTAKLSLFSIANPDIELYRSFQGWANGLAFIQDNLNSGETRFDYLIDNDGKTYILNKTSWGNKVSSKSPASIGLLIKKPGDKMSVSASKEWSTIKILFE